MEEVFINIYYIGILFEDVSGIKDGIWEEGEFIWGIWLYSLNN